MTIPTLSTPRFKPTWQKFEPAWVQSTQPTPAATITRQASSQTYYTIRFLADPLFRETAYQAYAYFRWVDDMVDRENIDKKERLAFLARQQDLINSFYRGERPDNLHPYEALAATMINQSMIGQYPEADSGLQIYINGMMAAITFDAQRKGRTISQSELDNYTSNLSTAVTELLHHCIGHGNRTPQDESRYAAVTGAHITHMLRDAVEDTAVGYYNIPQEYLITYQLSPTDLTHEAYRAWVKSRVEIARECFAEGRQYMTQLKNIRCRLAGFAYIGRFEIILDAIERDNYHLRPTYPERKSKTNVLKIALTALTQSLLHIL